MRKLMTQQGVRLAVALLAGLATPVFAAGSAEATPAKDPPSSVKAAPGSAGWVSRPAYAGARSQRGERYYARRYGVDQLQVRSISSGSSLEFRYRVLDPDKAAVLNDKNAKPYLVDQKTGNRLTVPTMEKIGLLRQVASPEAGREYWMVFANPGKLVKPGQRVDVVVGAFRATSLTVE
ncbi:MAG TPA: hypothetical protein VNW98_08550 [Burkholderiaceae bacterium]|jgi:hypothetical protein|nr:hypothetical protein [Burkholderiaceae bacterium]